MEVDLAEEISPSFSTLLHRLRAWWSPPTLPSRRVSNLTWGGIDLGAAATTLSITHDPDDKDLTLSLAVISGRPKPPDHDVLDALWHQSLSGQTEDGWRFSAIAAGMSSWSSSMREEVVERITVRAWDWTMFKENEGNVAWVADLTWDPPDYFGNLILRSGRGFSRGSYFLRSPSADYALLKSERSGWNIVVRPRHGDLSHASLRGDIDAIAFSFGADIELGHLFAVDEDLRVVGAMGGKIGHRSRRVRVAHPPVPSLNDLDSLPVLMFEAVTGTMARESEERRGILVMAMWYYVGSLAEYSAEMTIIKMLLSVVTVSRYLAGSKLQLVRDTEEFSQWVTRQSDELSLMEHEGLDGALRSAVSGCATADARLMVSLAARTARLELLPELRSALAAGFDCLGGNTLPDEPLQELLAKLRSLASGLISRAVGYKGRILGWERDGRFSSSEGTPSGWWDGDEEVAALQYCAQVAETPVDVSKLWPDIELPELPETGPVALVRRHADALSTATGGRIIGEVSPLPMIPGDPVRRYELVMRAARLRSAKAVLMVMSEEAGVLVVDGADGQNRVVMAGIAEFLTEMSGSDQTRFAIERLLIASLELERNATEA